MVSQKPELSAALAGQILDGIGEGLAVFDRRGRLVFSNRAFDSLWGEGVAPVSDLDGAVGRVRATSEDREVRRQLDAHLSDPAKTRRLELALDNDRFLELSLQPLPLRGGPGGRIWRLQNLTPQKRSEVALLHAQKLESLGVLAGGIAHDFNNLLSSILGHAELGLGDVEEASPVGRSLRGITRAAERASELTQQMLAYAGKGTVLVEPVDLSELAHEVFELVRVSIGSEVRTDLELAPDLPPIIADATQLRQVVMNLLLNAAEAVGPSGRIEVRTGVRRLSARRISAGMHSDETKPGDHVYLMVRDDGDGMDSATLARVFDPFFSTKFAGRGLGLAAVLGIVRGHHGLLEVRSTAGSGSRFTVHLPRGYEASQPAPE